MTEIQNPKQLALNLICVLDIVIWNLFGPILRSGDTCILLSLSEMSIFNENCGPSLSLTRNVEP